MWIGVGLFCTLFLGEMRMVKDVSTGGEMIDLSASGDGRVIVKPDFYDAFTMTQREAVEALHDHKKAMSTMESLKASIDSLLMDIAAWGKKNGATKILWGPRRDEGFFAVLAADEDENCVFQDALAMLELELRKKYKFRLTFLLFRASEAEGVESFINKSVARTIYGASTPSPHSPG